jgi:CheY-like chemotaxis protein/HPt (histidine-containing phosphotransfer) domain-containing protein
MSNIIQILIVDDNIINRQYFTMSLNKHGYQCIAVESGFEAIKKIHEHSFNLILMDIRMPEMDGYQTTAKIRQISGYQETPIIATSAENVDKSYQAYFNEFLLKPISPMQLLNCINKYALHTGTLDNNFNQDIALKYAYNDHEIMQKLISMFVEDLPKQFTLLHDNFERGEFQTCCDIIHKIRGSCKSCGADRLDSQLVKLTEYLKSGDNKKINVSMKKTTHVMMDYRCLIKEKLLNKEI